MRQFKCGREREVFVDLFYSSNTSVVPSVSPLTSVKRTRKTQRMFASNAPTNWDMQRYIRQQLSRRLASLERQKTLSFYSSYRLFTTGTKQTQKSARRMRKKKSLSPSSMKLTTKDRLRLSSRPSSSEKNSGQNESLLIKSPEELMERLNSGLDMARTAAREGYAALRNPANPGNKHDNHLLSARPESSGIREGSTTIEPKGLVMDINWWFWNILFAASPAVLVALYCQFIVIPEMKLRNDEREKDGDSESLGNSENKKSPMRQRQEQQKKQEPKIPVGDTMTKHSSSSPPRTGTNELDEVLSSYFRLLSSWVSGQQPPAFENRHGTTNKTDEVEKRSTKTNLDENQKQGGNEETSLEMQQQELNELLLRLQSLQDKIDLQEQEHGVDSIQGSDSDDVAPENSAKREPLLSTIGNRLKSTAASGINLGREQCRSLLSWWQTSRGKNRRGLSDESKRNSVDDVGDDGIVVTGNVDKKGKIEKPYQEVPRASRE